MNDGAEPAMFYGGPNDGEFAELRRRNGLLPAGILAINVHYLSTPHRSPNGMAIYSYQGCENSLNLKRKSK